MRTAADSARAPEQADITALAARFDAVRARTSELCAPLTAEDCAVQSMPDASPVKWHLAHTSWFFETFLLLPALAGYRVFDARFAHLFNSYYNSVGERVARADRGKLTRPGLEEVQRYRAHVERHVRELLASRAWDERAAGVLELGLHHEQQHQELILTDLKHAFAANPAAPVYRAAPVHRSTPATPAAQAARGASALAFARFDEGLHWIGHGGDTFAFDNEGPRHRVWVDAFELATRPVTNAEYLAFIDDGGYTRAELWLSDGWDALGQGQWRAPLYWSRADGSWETFTLGGRRALALEEPVTHVSYYEADAYARWAGARLPRESEWEVAAREAPVAGNFVESGALHPRPVDAEELREGRPAALFGDVWEWTQSAYGAYPGFRAAEGAFGEYNAKFMCNQLVLRGGSCASPQSHLRATYRNFFGPATRWQFSGIRLAR